MRIRTIKPSFWSDQRIRRLTIPARLLFIATWNLADDNGRLIWDVDYLRAQVFMSDHDLDVAALMAELEAAERVVPYESRGSIYAEVVNFPAHQTINNPSKTKGCPAPLRDDSRTTTVGLREDSPEEGKGREGKRQTARPANVAAELSTGSSSSELHERIIDVLVERAMKGRRGIKDMVAYAVGTRAKIEAEKGPLIDVLIAAHPGLPIDEYIDGRFTVPTASIGARLHVVKPTDPALLATPDEELAEPKSPAAKRAAARAKGAAK